MTHLGYKTSSIVYYRSLTRRFANWVRHSDIEPSTIDDDTVEQFICHCRKLARHDWSARFRTDYTRALNRFVSFLREKGAVPPVELVPIKTPNRRVLDFLEWLRRHRGVSESTVATHGRMIMKLLPALGDEPSTYDAGLVRRVILEEARHRSGPYIKALTTALRSYLKFLVAQGDCRAWLDHAVPTVARWRLSALPRYLPAAAVEQLIASCDTTKNSGIRDKAILLLLARLGLRAGDIVAMRLDDIEWRSGTLRVCGKGRREVRLPLPQDIGDAILLYLNGARPAIDSDKVFLRALAPPGPLAGSASVTCIVKYALDRAGITDAPSKGANLLRHTAATSMLRSGASLDVIGAVLRHRSVETTAHYAKVDHQSLRRIVQPWPGDMPC